MSEAPASTWDSVGAAAEGAFLDNPMTLFMDNARVSRANSRGERYSKQQAEDYAKEMGVKIDAPISGLTAEATALMVDRRRLEAQRNSTLERAPDGFFGTASRFTTGLIVGATDPLNIASAFIPVVGEARWARMLANTAGRTGARFAGRAAYGAIEGAAGAAMLEPLVYGMHEQLGDEYTMGDSLLNIGFGAIMGGGMHGVGGALGDKFRAGPDLHMRFSGLDLEEIKQVQAFEKRADLSPEKVKEATASWSNEMKRAAGISEPAPKIDEAPNYPLSTQNADRIAAYGDVSAPMEARGITQVDTRLKADYGGATAEGHIDGEDFHLTTVKAGKDMAETAMAHRNLVDEARSRGLRVIEDGKVIAEMGSKLTPTAKEIVASHNPETNAAAFQTGLAQVLDGYKPEVEAVYRTEKASELGPRASIGDVKKAVESHRKPENSLGLDHNAKIASEQQLERIKSYIAKPESVEAEEFNQRATERLTGLRDMLLAKGETEKAGMIDKALKQLDDMVATSEQYGNAAKAAALCGIG
jgi:hypothetical protein